MGLRPLARGHGRPGRGVYAVIHDPDESLRFSPRGWNGAMSGRRHTPGLFPPI